MPARIHWRGLRIRIIAWSFVPTIVIMIAVAAFIFNAYDNVTEDLLIEENRDSALFEAKQLATELIEYEDLLESEARIVGSLQENQPFQQNALTSSSNRFAVFDGGVILLDNYGMVAAAEPHRADILGEDWSNRIYYGQLSRSVVSVSAVLSDILTDGPDGMEVIVVAVPVTDVHGRFVGVLAGMFRMGASAVSAFYGDIVKLNWGEDGDAYIVDSTGKVIYHTNTDEIGKNVSSQDSVLAVLSGHSDAIRTNDIAGDNVLASYAPVPGTPWGLVIEEDWGEVIGSNRGYRNILMSLLALGVILPAIILFFGVRRITRPIAEVSSAAREIAAGNFSHRIAATTGDELEEMANQFNTMAGTLEESYNTLEQKVEDRTRGERRRADQLRAINDVGRKISSIMTLEELLPFIVASIQEAFEYYNVNIFLIDKNTGHLVFKAGAGGYTSMPPVGLQIKPGEGIVGWVASAGQHLKVDDVSREPRYNHIEELPDTRSELAVPLKAGAEILGVLDIESAEINAFEEMDVFTAETLADQLAVAIMNAQLYEQAGELATIDERQRLARDLHDAVTQILFSASIIAEVLPRIWEKNPDEGKKRLEEMRKLTRGALAEMRMLLLELRPTALTEAKLEELLRQLTEATTGRSTIPVDLEVEGECSVPPDIQVALYRIAQEALNNMTKHSGASEAHVTLHCLPDRTILTVSDNGRGFDREETSPDHLGLTIMHERAQNIGAAINIDSRTGSGTRIEVVWSDTGVKE